ncbi:MAG: TonB family protein [Terriglobales bacterium]
MSPRLIDNATQFLQLPHYWHIWRIDNPLVWGETPLQKLFPGVCPSPFMPPHPRPELDPSQPLSPSAESLPEQAAEKAISEADFAQLAARFCAENGGGLSPELSANLALEIVLNEIVEQACLATGATGAAIVLKRNAEMVCRASSGATAPDLGSPLDTASGLSGECLRTLRTQRCDDVLTDARADVEASLRLGVRSVIVMPLLQGEELLGVFELFSSRACAFGDRDERTLEALATRALTSLEHAAQPLPVAEVPLVEPLPVEASSVSENPVSENPASDPVSGKSEIEHSEILAAGPEGQENPAEAATGGFDFLTLALGVAVLACAVLLGVLVGRHLGIPTAKAHIHPVASPATNVSTPAAAPAGASSSGKAEGPGEAVPSVAAAKPRVSNSVPPGGLQVFENGKEIFRMPPTPGEPETTNAEHEVGMERASSLEPEKNEPVVELPPDVAESNLVHRVEPEYPEEARQQRIQGAVDLEVHVGTDGTVDDVQLVSGPAQLAPAATAAVRQWRFKPRRKNGHAVRMQTRITLNFRLPQ